MHACNHHTPEPLHPFHPAPPHRSCGALDTYASQAAGSGSHAALAVIFQRTVLFLLLHALPITALFFGLPALLRTLGQPAELCDRVGPYLAALAPAVWIDAVYR